MPELGLLDRDDFAAMALGYQSGERTPWERTVRTCNKLLQVVDCPWTFLEIEGIEPTNNFAERALRHSVIQRKISHGVHSASCAICRSGLLTATTLVAVIGRGFYGQLVMSDQVFIRAVARPDP